IVSGHPLASQVGIEIIQQGGNAVDAAVAVGFALAVVLPEAGNLGGGGFIVYRDTSGRVRALDYREMAPGRATRDMYVDSTGSPTEQSLTGHLASGVPGSVAGMYEAWKSAGRLPWAKLLAPAIRLAHEHTLDVARSRAIAEDAERLARFPASATQFLVEGHAPAPGTTFHQPELAHTLQLIADSGPAVFYTGQIADLIVAEMQRGHGLISKDDLKGYTPKWRTPVQISYRGYTIYSMPPASSGGVTLGEILNIMEGYDTLPPFGSAVTVTGAGFLLNNEMDDFTTAPGKPNMYGLIQGDANAIAPGKRMLSAMTPSIVLDRSGRLFMVLGTPGGPTIINSVYQVIVNVVDHGMSLVEAVAAPRVHQQALPDLVFYERGGLAQATLDGLRTMGYQLRERGRMGDIAAIERTAAASIGLADP